MGKEPTFVTAIRNEVLDLTLSSDNGDFVAADWRVLGEHSFSDHRYIEFSVSISPLQGTKPRNYRRTNWDLYRRLLRERLRCSTPKEPADASELETLVDDFTEACKGALDSSCPCTASAGRGKKTPLWWNRELGTLRQLSRSLFNRAKRNNTQLDWEIYRTSLSLYKKEIRRSKRASWKSFCEGIEGVNQNARFRRLLSKEIMCQGCILRDDGTWTRSSGESLDVLLDTHFPESDDCPDQPPVNIPSIGRADIRGIRSIVSLERLKWAIGGFGPFKSAGLDGIIPAQLQESIFISCGWLEVIFRNCLRLCHIPRQWRRTRVVFIPKAGRSSHVRSKDFRPISLSSFLLKTLERLMDLHIRRNISVDLLSGMQHAYVKGRSTETALHALVEKIEASLVNREFALGAFLDIEGAFNNILPNSVLGSLRAVGVEEYLVVPIAQLLVERTISAEWGGSVGCRAVRRGTPQGGVLSPLLWLIAVNTLLVELEGRGCQMVAYADDLAMVVRGGSPGASSRLMTGHLGVVSDWCGRNGLSLNPDKTELVLFTRRHRVPNFGMPSLNGVVLRLSEQVKYLGIILDRKLTWRPNIEERVRKAAVALYCGRRVVGKRWGLSPRSMMWVYLVVVRPVLLYGVIVWWRSLEKKSYLGKLGRIQRSALIGISGAMRTTPTAALEVFLNIWPLDITAKYLACSAMIRVREAGLGISHYTGHAGILRCDAVVPDKTDYCSSSHLGAACFGTRIPCRNIWRKSPDGDGDCLRFFTDGSKMGNRVGYGVFSPDLGIRASYSLPGYCSVFQAEVMAIREVACWLLRIVTTSRRVRIYSDSQAAIRSLGSVFARSRMVLECYMSLGTVAEYFNIELVWVPGHSDIPGNCVADELARRGTTGEQVVQNGGEVEMPLSSCLTGLRNWAVDLFSNRWRQTTTCRQARELGPVVDYRRATQLVGLPRRWISAVVGIFSGHFLVGRHSIRLGYGGSTLCSYCLEEEEVTTRHLLLECPALSSVRKRTMGYHLLDPGRLLEIPVGQVGRFVFEADLDPLAIVG